MKHELHVNASPDAVWQEITKRGFGSGIVILLVAGLAFGLLSHVIYLLVEHPAVFR